MHEQSPDLILVNGKIILMDRENTVAEAIAIKDGKIHVVGSSEEIKRLAGIHTKSIDLGGRVVMPGFIDCHTHVDLVGMMNSDRVVNCRIPPLKSVEDILKNISKKAEEILKGELILGQGRWFQPLPTKRQLDEVSPNHPVILKNTMHSMLLNSFALNKFGITAKRPTVKEFMETGISGKIHRNVENGEPTGWIEDGWNYLFPNSHTPFSYNETKVFIKEGLNRYARVGVTTITELFITPESFKIYQKLKEDNELNVTLHLVPCVHGVYKTVNLDSVLDFGIKTGFGNEWIKFGGVKIFLDSGTDTTLSSLELKEILKQAHCAGIRVFIHATTRKSQDIALEALEATVESRPEQDLRHRIEHMGNRLWDLNYFERVKKLGAVAVPTAYIINIGLSYPEGLKMQVYRTMLDKGLCVPGNSDSAGAEPEAPNPFYQIWCMVERKLKDGTVKYPEEKVSVMEAL